MPFSSLSLAEQLSNAMSGAAFLFITQLLLRDIQRLSTGMVDFRSAGGGVFTPRGFNRAQRVASFQNVARS
jgi:hypothetical protein